MQPFPAGTSRWLTGGIRAGLSGGPSFFPHHLPEPDSAPATSRATACFPRAPSGLEIGTSPFQKLYQRVCQEVREDREAASGSRQAPAPFCHLRLRGVSL